MKHFSIGLRLSNYRRSCYHGICIDVSSVHYARLRYDILLDERNSLYEICLQIPWMEKLFFNCKLAKNLPASTPSLFLLPDFRL